MRHALRKFSRRLVSAKKKIRKLFENTGTISAEVKMNYYDDNVGVDLFENAKFVDAEGGKIEAMELSGKLVGSGEVRFGANLTFTLLREKIAGFIATEKRGGVRLFFKKCRFRRLARLVKWISATFALPKERREKARKTFVDAVLRAVFRGNWSG